MKKSLLFLLLFIFSFLGYSTVYSQRQGLKDSLLSRLEELKKETKVKSMLAGVWKGEKEILTFAKGESMTSFPASTDMHFRIGGISETFFGTLLMILVDQGKLSLSDKISKWLPNLLSSDSVTVRMLIKNTAGYKDYVLNDAFVNLITKEPFRNVSRDEIIVYSTSGGELNFRPGTNWKYSHTEFTILGEVMEKAAGKTMAELYEENIFLPLGLINTGYSSNPDLPSPVLHVFSSDRDIYEDATFWNPSWVGESGPLYSNLSDIGKWGPVFGTGKLLTKESFNELISPYKDTVRGDFYFASGFAVVNTWYCQNPSYNGYYGAFGFHPGDDYTIVVFISKAEDTAPGNFAFSTFKELTKIVTPEHQVNFK